MKYKSRALLAGLTVVLALQASQASAVTSRSSHQKQLTIYVTHTLKPGVDGGNPDSDYISTVGAGILPVSFVKQYNRLAVCSQANVDNHTPGCKIMGDKYRRSFEGMVQEFGGMRINKAADYFSADTGDGLKVQPRPLAFPKLWNELNFWLIQEDIEYVNFLNVNGTINVVSLSAPENPANPISCSDAEGGYVQSCRPPNFRNMLNRAADSCRLWSLGFGGDSASCLTVGGQRIIMTDIARYVRMTQRPDSLTGNYAQPPLVLLPSPQYANANKYDCENSEKVVNPAEGNGAAGRAFGFYLSHLNGAFLLKKSAQNYMRKYGIPTAWIDIEQEVLVHAKPGDPTSKGQIIRVAGSIRLDREDIVSEKVYSGLNAVKDGKPFGTEKCTAVDQLAGGGLISGAVMDNPEDGQFIGVRAIGSITASTGSTTVAGSPGTPTIGMKKPGGKNILEVVYINGLSGQWSDFWSDHTNTTDCSSEMDTLNHCAISRLPVAKGMAPWMDPIMNTASMSGRVTEINARGKIWVHIRDEHGIPLRREDIQTASGGLFTSNPFPVTAGLLYEEFFPSASSATAIGGEINKKNPSILDTDRVTTTLAGKCLLNKMSSTLCSQATNAVDVRTLMEQTGANRAYVTYASRWELIPNLLGSGVVDEVPDGAGKPFGKSGLAGPMAARFYWSSRKVHYNLCQRPVYDNPVYADYRALRRPVFHWKVSLTGDTFSETPNLYYDNGERSVAPASAIVKNATGTKTLLDFSTLVTPGAPIPVHDWYGTVSLPRLVSYPMRMDFARWGYIEKGAIGYNYNEMADRSDLKSDSSAFNLFSDPLRNSGYTETTGARRNPKGNPSSGPYFDTRMPGLVGGWITTYNSPAEEDSSFSFIGGDTEHQSYAPNGSAVVTHTFTPNMLNRTEMDRHSKEPNSERRQDVFGCTDMNPPQCVVEDVPPQASSVPLPYVARPGTATEKTNPDGSVVRCPEEIVQTDHCMGNGGNTQFSIMGSTDHLHRDGSPINSDHCSNPNTGETCTSWYQAGSRPVARSRKWAGSIYQNGVASSFGATVSHFSPSHGSDKVYPTSTANNFNGANESDRNTSGAELYACHRYFQGMKVRWEFHEQPARSCEILSFTRQAPIVGDPAQTVYYTQPQVAPSCETRVSVQSDDTNHYGHLNPGLYHEIEEARPTFPGSNIDNDYYDHAGMQDECEEYCGPGPGGGAFQSRTCVTADSGVCMGRPGAWAYRTAGYNSPSIYSVKAPETVPAMVIQQQTGKNVAPPPRQNTPNPSETAP